jgi:DNA-binding winged helix-turn-helix (wHTH) protein
MNTSAETARPDLHDFRVDGWLVQPRLNRLVRGETSIRLRPQLLEVLACLAVEPGAVVTKDQLLATVWTGRHICEAGIARCVAELRQVLADDARRPRIIETITKRGYRLIAPVVHDTSEQSPAAAKGFAPGRESGVVDSSPPSRLEHSGGRTRSMLAAATGLISLWNHHRPRAAV